MLAYDPASGSFTWLVDIRNGNVIRRRAGSVAGHSAPKLDGAIQVRIDRRLYLAHRLAWLYMTDEWPSDQIDHINGNPRDNRWGNIRSASQMQNSWNVKKHADNSTGLKGVTWRSDTKKWFARLMKDGKQNHLGTFDCPAAAHFSYVVAASLAFADFARSA